MLEYSNLDLFNGNDFESYRDVQEIIIKIIERKLNEASELHVLINVGNGIRNIGKTESLIMFAIKNGYSVVVKSKIKTNVCSRDIGYCYIFSQYDNELKELINKKVVIDEGVDKEKLEKEMGVEVITGYYNGVLIKQDYSKSIEENTIANLEYEAEQLQLKIKKTREAENMGTYKNLAQNLEIILKLLDERKG
jgi:hypothetical protein